MYCKLSKGRDKNTFYLFWFKVGTRTYNAAPKALDIENPNDCFSEPDSCIRILKIPIKAIWVNNHYDIE